MTICSRRWRCCPLTCRGALCISAAAGCPRRCVTRRNGAVWRRGSNGAQPEVLAAYRHADLFVLAAKVAADGDRDGLPNVLMEALSQRLACVTTAVAGIPELIDNGATGVLVPPGEPSALAAALAALIGDPQRRALLGAAGERRVRSRFALTANLGVVAQAFGLSLAPAAAASPVDPIAAAAE